MLQEEKICNLEKQQKSDKILWKKKYDKIHEEINALKENRGENFGKQMKDYSVDLNKKVESLEKQLKSKPTINVFDSSENITDRIKTIEEKLNKQDGQKHVETKSADIKTPASNEADIYIIGDSNTGKIK